ncbi:MAG TPA: PAS domain S-box protein [Rhizomicrobium sp.]|jgi:PAS domain S-box-containing protein|nr:PAS domain S-box protein [Rhizomicrobium sp.]
MPKGQETIGGKTRVERALEKSEIRFRQVVEAAPNAIVMIGVSGRIEMINVQAERVFGHSRAEMLGQPVEMLIPERFRAHHPGHRSAFFEAPQSRPMGVGRELFALKKDGSEFPVEIGLSPIETDEGLMVLSVVVDITDRRQKFVQTSYLAAIVESSSDAIIGKNLDGIVTSWNPAAEALFGHASREAVGRHISFLIPPDRLAEADMILDRIRRGERVENFETMRRNKDGCEIPVSLTVSPILGPGGTILGASKIARDVTERQRAADTLRLSEERFRSIFGAVGEGIFITDAEGRFIEVNGPGAEMFGYSTDRMIGLDIQSISSGMPPYTQAEAIEWQRKAAISGRPQIFEWHCKARSGRLFWVEISLRQASIGGGAVGLAIVRDISERRTIEAQLRQAQKMEAVGLLTGGIAHDFNNLLAIIHGNLELIRDASADTPEVHEMTEDALRAAARGASLTHQLLAYARQQPLAPKVVLLEQLVSQVAQLIRRSLGETIEIRTVIPKDLWATRIDPNQLENALVNLAVNARDAMPDGGKLTIEGANKEFDADYAESNPGVVPGCYVQLAVSDSGPGIPPEIIDRVFEPFFTTKPLGKGSGLGLSMVFGFVKQSGGHIKIYSEAGRGTTFNLYLPRASEQLDDCVAADDSGAVRGREMEVILVVEDDELVRKFTVRVLRGLGYRIIEAGDGHEALRLLNEAGRVDLLLTDVALPKGMSGPAIAAEARKRRRELKVLYMSGYAKDAIVNNGVLEEGVQLLTKPFPKTELARKIRDMLDEGGAA